MKTSKITMVRIYLSTDDSRVSILLQRLQDWEKVKNITLFEALSGFGKIELRAFPDKSPPVVVEFFDYPDRVDCILQDLAGFIASEQIVTWQAELGETE